VFVAAAAAFVAIERSVRSPMLPLATFANPSFSAGNIVGLLINLGFYGELFVLNLYFQQVLKYSALLAGLAMLPQMGMASVASLLSGRFTGRAGSPRPAMLTGLLLGAAGLLALLIADAHTPYLQLIVPRASRTSLRCDQRRPPTRQCYRRHAAWLAHRRPPPIPGRPADRPDHRR
jgi:DHA2 family methylenomycin A resistance protein-like MFS transporter